MRVSELIEMLSDVDGDSEVRFAAQPSWPFEYSVDTVEVVDLAESDGEQEVCPLEVVYLVEGDQLGYLPNRAAVAIGWRDRS